MDLTNDHVLDVDFKAASRRVVHFAVNLRRWNGRWIPVARIDTDHGHLHEHRHGHTRPLPEPTDGDYASALTAAVIRLKEVARAGH